MWLCRVDQPDVDLDNDDVPGDETIEDAPMETDVAPEFTETTKKAMKLSYEKYKKMSFLLIDLVEHRQIVEKVVDRLIYQDQVIVPLTKISLN